MDAAMNEPWQEENEICESFFQGMKINSVALQHW